MPVKSKSIQTAPELTSVHPGAAMPGGEVEVYGANLSAHAKAAIGGRSAPLAMARANRATVQIPEGMLSADITLTVNGVQSNGLAVEIATPLTENLHPVTNPAIDRYGNIYATLSGSRGQQTPVSIFKMDAHGRARPFVRELMNPTGLAFGPDGYLYVSSRAEGSVYRVSPEGDVFTYAEGLGIATGIAFSPEGSLFVGDRSGTIFKIGRSVAGEDSIADRETFVFATLEPSMAAYHLAFSPAGMLYVTGPTTSSHQSVHAIDRDGNAQVFYRGLGRAQGMAVDRAGDLYVVASLCGDRGLVRITPDGVATLVLSGNSLVGLAFHPDGRTILATRDALYQVELGVRA